MIKTNRLLAWSGLRCLPPRGGLSVPEWILSYDGDTYVSSGRYLSIGCRAKYIRSGKYGVYRAEKAAGEAPFPLPHLLQGVWIVKSSSGWMGKGIINSTINH
jgi:hypothetical protein